MKERRNGNAIHGLRFTFTGGGGMGRDGWFGVKKCGVWVFVRGKD